MVSGGADVVPSLAPARAAPALAHQGCCPYRWLLGMVGYCRMLHPPTLLQPFTSNESQQLEHWAWAKNAAWHNMPTVSHTVAFLKVHDKPLCMNRPFKGCHPSVSQVGARYSACFMAPQVKRKRHSRRTVGRCSRARPAHRRPERPLRATPRASGCSASWVQHQTPARACSVWAVPLQARACSSFAEICKGHTAQKTSSWPAMTACCTWLLSWRRGMLSACLPASSGAGTTLLCQELQRRHSTRAC